MITFPPRKDAPALKLETEKHSPVVIVGANGAGKTRFSNRLAADLGDAAYRLNAIDALYNVAGPDTLHSAIDRLHAAAPAVPAYEKARPQTRLDRLLSVLLGDELINLLRIKFGTAGRQQSSTEGAAAPKPTRMDRLISFWRQVFPGNRVLVDTGNILFAREDSDDTISAKRLSVGERTVLFYGIAVLYAPAGAVIMADSPEIFLHPATMQGVWNRLEKLRPDCTFIYTTHDLEFAASRPGARFVWVRSCDTAAQTWDYELIPEGSELTDRISLAIIGTRKPVLFIEGDSRSIDARLYPLIFPDYTVKSLGSCNKVIEATRTFNDLSGFHHLRAAGIVDRDRREDGEVEYLRQKNIMVPEVAEIENMLLLPEVVDAVATSRGRDGARVVASVRKGVLGMFRGEIKAQALQHTRHRVKRTVEYRIDGRFGDIGALEKHISSLVDEINPRGLYERFCREFNGYSARGDYRSVLRVYNQKSMLPGSNVASLCGLNSKAEYIDAVMAVLRADNDGARKIRTAVRRALLASDD